MRLVLADNDRDALELIELDLGLEGHEILATADDGEGALEACRRCRPDVLVVDHRMPPGVDGLEVARRVLEEGTAVRVVLYTNHLGQGLPERARRIGATWLRKGDLVALRAAVEAGGVKHHRPGPEAG